MFLNGQSVRNVPGTGTPRWATTARNRFSERAGAFRFRHVQAVTPVVFADFLAFQTFAALELKTSHVIGQLHRRHPSREFR
jgi:hypothetical protein